MPDPAKNAFHQRSWSVPQSRAGKGSYEWLLVAATLISNLQEEVIAYVRRRSNAFSRGKSRFRGVSGREGRWETRIDRSSSERAILVNPSSW